MSQAVQIAPFGPSPVRQKKMPQTIFRSEKSAALEEIGAVSGLKMIHLTPVVFLNNSAFDNFRQHVPKMKLRTQRTNRNSEIGEFPGQVAL
jgi:hypothetical protein